MCFYKMQFIDGFPVLYYAPSNAGAVPIISHKAKDMAVGVRRRIIAFDKIKCKGLYRMVCGGNGSRCLLASLEAKWAIMP